MAGSSSGAATATLNSAANRANAMPQASGGKGGGQSQPPSMRSQFTRAGQPPTQTSPGQTPTGGFNVNQAASQSLQDAMATTRQGMQFQPMQARAFGYNPQQQRSVGTQRAFGYDPSQQRVMGQQTAVGYDPAQAQAQQLATTDISQYQNPYQQQVIDAAMRDIGRQQEQSLNTLGAQATRAGAFGGSRQGIAEAETRKGFAEQAADTAAQLRAQGFQNAQQAAQFDVSQRAATEAANVAAQQAAQQFGAQSQQAVQAANIAQRQNVEAQNVAARTAAAQQMASARNAAEAANIARLQGIQGQNAAAQTAANQYFAGNQMTAQQQNIANQFNALAARQGAANQLAQLGQQGFDYGQQIMRNQMDQGGLAQGVNQTLLDAAGQQYAGYTGAPVQTLQTMLQSVGAGNMGQGTTTQTRNPGLFDYLQMGAQTAAAYYGGSDPRLKDDIKKVGEVKGINLYTWKWNDTGKKVALPNQPEFGVMADELQKTHPQFVKRGDDGYLRVNYGELIPELMAS